MEAPDLALADERIEALLAAVWPSAEQGNRAAVDVARRLIELKAKLHGMTKPAAADETHTDELASYRRRHSEPAG